MQYPVIYLQTLAMVITRLSMIISKIVRFVSIMVASINMVSSGSQDLNLNQEYWLAPCQGQISEENFALKTDSLFHGRIHSFLPHHITWQFCRLLPVLDVPIFSKNTSADGNSNKGIAAYKHIREVFKLDVILRQTVHTGGNKAKKASSDVAKVFEPQLLLAKEARVMLTANLWISNKSGTICSRQQVRLYLVWAITIYKSQGLMLSKSKADIGSKKFAAELTFIAVSHIYSLSDIYFRQFMFDRLQCNKNSSRLQERKTEEESLHPG
ncbi:ATP-dependent DNA helicase PIF1-like [Rhizophagus irregularis DAOM 181602=DAOM 197198]|nr:ATP-dependent DNA helicase PIF1-like [Rhizophagus irregularis DAOM 181602=DAOM 197198]